MGHQRTHPTPIRDMHRPDMAAHREADTDITSRRLRDRSESTGQDECFRRPHTQLEFGRNWTLATAGSFDFHPERNRDIVDGGVGECVYDEGARADTDGSGPEEHVFGVEDDEVVELDVGVVREDGFPRGFGGRVDSQEEFSG